MNDKTLKLLCIVLIGAYFDIYAQVTLLIKDKQTKYPIANTTIICNNNISETDTNGEIHLSILEGKHYIEIIRLGYVSYKGDFTFKRKNTIFLEVKHEVLSEAVVHGRRHITEKTEVATTLNAKDIAQNTSASLGDVLSKIEGVSSIKTGGTIVKPVIHGMYGNRIVMLNNGVLQQGQDWSTEHAPEIDPYATNEISVIKGAEGVKYGSGAIGGVVLINPKKLPYSSENIKGQVISVLASNGNSSTFSGLVGDSFYDNKMAWQVQGTRHISADVKTANYFLNNSGTNSYNFFGNIGYKTNNFGIESFYSLYNNTYGIAFISEVGNQEDFNIRFENGKPLQFFPATYTIKAPKQAVTHHLGKINSFWKPNDTSELKLQYDFQFNNREEYFVRRASLSKIPAFHTQLKTHRISSSYEFHWNEHWKSEFGMNYQNQINENVSGTKIDPIIPNYTNIGFGGFIVQKFTKNLFEISAGIRYDAKSEKASGIKSHIRYRNSRDFKNWVGSISASYHWNDFSFISNLGMAWRSPHVSELYSNGLKHGALFYILGNAHLKPENGLKWINNITYHNENLYIHLSGFVQKLNNYIYDQPTTETITLWGGNYFRSYYLQADAFFRGIDLNTSYHINNNWEYVLKGSLVYATNLENNSYFPFIPSERIRQEIKFKKSTKKGFIDDFYTSIGHQYVAKQIRFDTNSDIKPSPDSYHLFTLTSGFSATIFNDKKLSFQLSIDNLLNKSYKEYTNRFRYFNHDLGRNIQIKTIINF